MVPSNAIYNELINFLLSVFDKSSIIFAVILHLFISLQAWASIFLRFISVYCCDDSHHTFEQQEHIVERVNFELLKKCSFNVSLHLISFGEFAIHIDFFEVVDHTDLFTIVYLFVILEKLGDDFLV